MRPTGPPSTNLAVASGATDFLTIVGSSTKKIEVLKITLGGLATALTVADIVLLKRSTANSGGTSTAPTAVPLDSNDIAASAAVKAYTANPATLGTLVGNILSRKVVLDAAATPGNGVTVDIVPAAAGKHRSRGRRQALGAQFGHGDAGPQSQ